MKTQRRDLLNPIRQPQGLSATVNNLATRTQRIERAPVRFNLAKPLPPKKAPQSIVEPASRPLGLTYLVTAWEAADGHSGGFFSDRYVQDAGLLIVGTFQFEGSGTPTPIGISLEQLADSFVVGDYELTLWGADIAKGDPYGAVDFSASATAFMGFAAFIPGKSVDSLAESDTASDTSTAGLSLALSAPDPTDIVGAVIGTGQVTLPDYYKLGQGYKAPVYASVDGLTEYQLISGPYIQMAHEYRKGGNGEVSFTTSEAYPTTYDNALMIGFRLS